jgi:hypothetical protein
VTPARCCPEWPSSCAHFWLHLFGPESITAAKVRELRICWENGARENLMHPRSSFRRPGTRPWSWWRFDYPNKQKRRAERRKHPVDEMALIEWAGGDYPGEREAWLKAQREQLERAVEFLTYLKGRFATEKFRDAADKKRLEEQLDEAAMEVARLKQQLEACR